MRIEGSGSTVDYSTQVKETGEVKTSNHQQASGDENGKPKITSEDIKNHKYTKEELPISEKALMEAIEKANKALEGPNKRFEFAIHEKTHEIMVKVFNKDTGEIIREFPPEKILDMVAKMWEMTGLIVDERR